MYSDKPENSTGSEGGGQVTKEHGLSGTAAGNGGAWFERQPLSHALSRTSSEGETGAAGLPESVIRRPLLKFPQKYGMIESGAG